MKKMPNQTLYLVLTILGFALGIVWGLLSLDPYKRMKAAIAANDAATAIASAAKIKKWFIIGLIVNVLIVIGQLAQAGAI